MASNRRTAYRHPMALPIDLRVSGVRAPVAATLTDLSGGGGMISARAALKEKSAVEFDLPREGQPHLRLPGRIRKVTFMPSERAFKYAVEFENLDDETREALHRFIVLEQRRDLAVTRRGTEPSKPTRSAQEQRAHRRIDVDVPVRIAIVEVPGSMEATLVDVSTGGARILIDHVLRQEWVVNLRFTLPSEMLKGDAAPFKEMRINARALPGIRQQRGKYIQTLAWVHPDPMMTAEINRFVQAAHLTALRRV